MDILKKKLLRKEFKGLQKKKEMIKGIQEEEVQKVDI